MGVIFFISFIGVLTLVAICVPTGLLVTKEQTRKVVTQHTVVVPQNTVQTNFNKDLMDVNLDDL